MMTAEDDKVAGAARQLFDEHRSGARLDGLPGELWPADMATAYAIQDGLLGLHEAAGEGAIAGWKVALTTPVMQAMVGVNEPCEGAILAHRRHDSPARLAAGDFVNVGVESEIAVRLGKDLDGGTHDRESVAGAVAACMAAIEIVDDRGIDYSKIDAPLLIADNAFNFGCVLGPEVIAWRDLDLAQLQGRMAINGEVVGEGLGGDVMGHPLEALAWLANNLNRRARPLRAGQIMLTGSIVATKWLKAGERMESQIDSLGEARLELS